MNRTSNTSKIEDDNIKNLLIDKITNLEALLKEHYEESTEYRNEIDALSQILKRMKKQDEIEDAFKEKMKYGINELPLSNKDFKTFKERNNKILRYILERLTEIQKELINIKDSVNSIETEKDYTKRTMKAASPMILVIVICIIAKEILMISAFTIFTITAIILFIIITLYTLSDKIFEFIDKIGAGKQQQEENYESETNITTRYR